MIRNTQSLSISTELPCLSSSWATVGQRGSTLASGRPIGKVPDLAAQFEPPAQHRAAGDTWELLISMIDQL